MHPAERLSQPPPRAARPPRAPHPRAVAVAVAVAASLAAAGQPARAGPDPGGVGRDLAAGPLSGGSTPWTRGVSAERRHRAAQLYRAGKALLERTLLSQALDKWVQATVEWDHPYLRWKLALLLDKLNQPVEAYFHIAAAVKWGPDPFTPEEWQHVLRSKTLLDSQVAWISVTCRIAGARVTLDGNYLFTGSGRATKLVTVGRHQIVAEKPGYLPDAETVVLVPGQRAEIELSLQPTGEQWIAPWKPWAVFAVGVAAVVAAVPVEAQSQIDFNDHDAMCRAGGPGCDDLFARATLLHRTAIGVGVAGGAAIVGGLVLVGYNRRRLPASSAPSVPGARPRPAPGAAWLPAILPSIDLGGGRLGVDLVWRL